MAWIDNRMWAHPKVTELSHEAFRVYVNGLAYCSGMNTRGHLTSAQQSLLLPRPVDAEDEKSETSSGRVQDEFGTSRPQDSPQDVLFRVRRELVRAGLWEKRNRGAIYVHDWHDHNGVADARKERDRERKRLERARERDGASTLKRGADYMTKDQGQPQGQNQPPAKTHARTRRFGAGFARDAGALLPDVAEDYGW